MSRARLDQLTSTLVDDGGGWRSRAACLDEDPELFFPIGTSGPALLQVERAKAVCRRCPVLGECLNWAMQAGETYGVWGGLAEDERRHLAPRRGGRLVVTWPGVGQVSRRWAVERARRLLAEALLERGLALAGLVEWEITDPPPPAELVSLWPEYAGRESEVTRVVTASVEVYTPSRADELRNAA